MYAKSLEAQERQTYERKQQMKDALASGKLLPTELKRDARNLGKDLAFDDAQTGASKFPSMGIQSHLNFRPDYTYRQRILPCRNTGP